ncbi:acyltransferase [Paraburkholderia sp.]|uniref:acyltransferase family protein n=1 Tax=Paraburkholderia sp. TaxID=1926495 RepID=UPI00239BDA5B|nr:acyltransferase [Paraburkholderia sp.]MDE1184310.1 acyltransferase [Paraburkholderia sp.]
MSDSAFDASGATLSSTLPASAASSIGSPVRTAAVGKEEIIDVMRGFAALLVAYFHCRQIEWVGMRAFHQSVGHSHSLSTIIGYLTFPIAWGSAGVPIFFVISGYCIHRSAAFRFAQNPAYRLDTSNFWLRRFVRIYPVLLAALVLTLALDSISLQLPPVNHRINDIGLMPFLVNLFSLQGLALHTYGSNGALWTLSLEVQFYVIYPLLFALRRKIGMTKVLAIVAVVNVVSAALLEPRDIQFFTSYWFAWTIGAWIADARAAKSVAATSGIVQRPASRGLYVAAAVFTVLGCVVFNYGQFGAFQCWAIGFAFYLYKALEPKAEPGAISRAVSKVLSPFGDFSFSLYLIHLPIFVLLGSVLFRSELQVSIWPSFGFMVVAVIVAYGFYRLVELPAMRWSARLKPRRG